MSAEARSLLAEFDECLGGIRAAAKAAKEHPEQWAKAVNEWTNAAPEGFDSSGKSGHPSDMRKVLLAVQTTYVEKFAPFEGRTFDDDEFEDQLWDVIHRRLPDLARDELQAYMKSIKPPVSIGGLFAKSAVKQKSTNAQTTVKGQESSDMMTCQTCGAPREKDTLYGDCAFCGTAFFSKG